MDSDEVVYKVLSEVCPGTYEAWDTGKAPALPWFAWSYRRGGEFFADDSNYSRLPHYRVELLFKEMDPELIGRFEDALSRLGTWRLYNADKNEAERCYVHDYNLACNLGKIRRETPTDG